MDNFPIIVGQGFWRKDIKVKYGSCCELEFQFMKWKEVIEITNKVPYMTFYDKETQAVVSSIIYPSSATFPTWWNSRLSKSIYTDSETWTVRVPMFCVATWADWVDAYVDLPWIERGKCYCYEVRMRNTWPVLASQKWIWCYGEICFLDTRKCNC